MNDEGMMFEAHHICSVVHFCLCIRMTSDIMPNVPFLVCLSSISAEFGPAMFCIFARHSWAKIPMANVGGAVASWLVRSSPDRAVWVRALAGDIVLCSWARHLTLKVPLSTQVYKWVPVNLMLEGNPAMDWHPIQGGVEILLVASCHGNWS